VKDSLCRNTRKESSGGSLHIVRLDVAYVEATVGEAGYVFLMQHEDGVKGRPWGGKCLKHRDIGLYCLRHRLP